MKAWVAALFDLLCVLAFTALGVRAHAQTDHLLRVAVPFLAALAIGWLIARPLKNMASLRAGAVIWLTTLIGGMLLRRLGGDGTALPFVLVATTFLAVTMLGWRLIAALGSRRRRERPDARVTVAGSE